MTTIPQSTNTIVRTNTVETSVLELLKLRQHCTQSLSNEIVCRIRLIRDKCLQSEKKETSDGGNQFAWRRGGSSGHAGGSVGSVGKQQNRSVVVNSNHWRGQSALAGSVRPTTTAAQGSYSDKGSHRYVSKFTNSSSPVEDKILNQVILNKLNKFSQTNYQEVKEFLQQILDSNEHGFLRDFMLLVFKKAACEPTFCPLYARMISELSVNYPSLLKELETLYSEYLTIFQEIEEDQCKDYDQFVQRNRDKLHRHGYSQFLGELTRVGILNKNQIFQLYTTIFDQIKLQAGLGETKQKLVEEYVDCLLRMTKTFHKENSRNLLELRNALRGLCEPIIESILAKRSSQFPGLSTKASFGLMDCLDIFRETLAGTTPSKRN
jgi:hypothetical protein